MNKTTILVIIGLIFLIGAGLYIYNPEPIEYRPAQEEPAQEEPVFCTMDAKLCSDGSYVGRTGPNCEFAPCPDDGTEAQN